MKRNLLVIFFLINFCVFSQKPMVVCVGNDSVCHVDETPTGKSGNIDRATLWLRADKTGQIIYNCPSQLQKAGAKSGVYTFDPDGDGLNLMQGYYDSSEGGGWLMIMNYVHQGGTSPAGNFRSTDLPLLGSSTLGTNEGGTIFWGQAIPALVGQFDVSEVRYYGITSNHNRVMHFSTTDIGTISYIKTGTGSMSGMVPGFTTLTGHTTSLPGSATLFDANRGNLALTRNPFRTGNPGSIRFHIGFNNNRFDNKWLNTRAVYYNININTHVKSLDLMKQAKLSDNGSYALLDKVGHMGFFESKKECFDIVKGFVG